MKTKISLAEIIEHGAEYNGSGYTFVLRHPVHGKVEIEHVETGRKAGEVIVIVVELATANTHRLTMGSNAMCDIVRDEGLYNEDCA